MSNRVHFYRGQGYIPEATADYVGIALLVIAGILVGIAIGLCAAIVIKIL